MDRLIARLHTCLDHHITERDRDAVLQYLSLSEETRLVLADQIRQFHEAERSLPRVTAAARADEQSLEP